MIALGLAPLVDHRDRPHWTQNSFPSGSFMRTQYSPLRSMAPRSSVAPSALSRTTAASTRTRRCAGSCVPALAWTSMCIRFLAVLGSGTFCRKMRGRIPSGSVMADASCRRSSGCRSSRGRCPSCRTPRVEAAAGSPGPDARSRPSGPGRRNRRRVGSCWTSHPPVASVWRPDRSGCVRYGCPVIWPGGGIAAAGHVRACHHARMTDRHRAAAAIERLVDADDAFVALEGPIEAGRPWPEPAVPGEGPEIGVGPAGGPWTRRGDARLLARPDGVSSSRAAARR